ncbi:xylulokinase [Pseudomonas sp. KNUC1026]|uniref:xylulokinase n=1 Tax=Pseudomonas sp. KNUC1026 TaxID=2893890 RepID=UPI001F15F862|nr:xylulokinase [Pseudomonas sp. KNUC1026]UFH50943.1 xylulokinase [Pseudomonas sp. KNUC1026]
MYLGIDCGTQGTKALLLDAAGGRVLGVGSAAHEMISGPHGRREQDPAQWRRALTEAVAQALAAAGVDGQRVQALSVSGQQHGLVMLDADGQVLRPAKLWCDTESTSQNTRLLEWLGGPQGSLERLGLVIAPGYTVSKLLWSREHAPEAFARARHILLPHDYLNFWLTGEHCAEYGDASGTGYFNIRTRTWDLALLRHISPDGQLESALPRLLQADEAVGRLRPEVARELGLNPAALVASGGGDNMMGAIGTGNIQPGHITMSLGSSGTVYAYSAAPLVSEEGAVAAFCSSSGGWLPLICTMNLTNTTGLVRDLLQLNQHAFDQHLRTSPIGAEGVLMLPFFNGERVPALPDATASLHGLTSNNFNAANLCRAAVEGTTFGLRYGLDLLRASGLPSHSIRLIGGGSKNSLWRQMVADIMATPVMCTEEPEAAALGAAIQAAWCAEGGGQARLAELCQRCVQLAGASEHRPQPAAVAAYAPVYDAYRQQVLAL